MASIVEQIKALSAYFEGWNNNQTSARDRIVSLSVPVVKRFAEQEFSRNKVVNTPIKLFSPDDIAQEVAIRLIKRQSSIHIDGPNDFVSLLRRIIYSVIAEHIKRLTSTRHGLGNRVRFNESEANQSMVNEHHESEKILTLMSLYDQLERLHRPQALALNFHQVMGLSLSDTAEVLGVSERTARRYIEFSEAWLKAEFRKVLAA
ncbi:sigma-70 family RNA polymerase sigma factor [Endozoicomonas sp. G2_1]|uniref:sigma-70 family RNA polymerase sigma factor n=1 Tax=Endozoicomonas sp. G2_1 TaxID=2821091 RepID=UPI001ADCBCEF|nr:sigma-70 family RNA polymerase sigma factor [Endozoicomonas sp. G2_1]MBO9492199.1 sigma-70 family RNA polymerase sigma factor [Endozoicomonas sp. G2_1]